MAALAVAVLFGGVPAATAAHQDPATLMAGVSADAREAAAPHRGFWLDAGVGIASVGFGGDAGDFGVEREGGLSVRGGAGYAPGARLRLGAEAAVWSKESAGVTATIWTLSGVAYFFPVAHRGFWLKGGIGALMLDESGIGNRGDGVAWTGAIGHDFAVGRRSIIAPYLQTTFSHGVEIVQRGATTGFTENPSILQVGVAFVWR